MYIFICKCINNIDRAVKMMFDVRGVALYQIRHHRRCKYNDHVNITTTLEMYPIVHC